MFQRKLQEHYARVYGISIYFMSEQNKFWHFDYDKLKPS